MDDGKITGAEFLKTEEGRTAFKEKNMQHQLVLVNERWDRIEPDDEGNVDNAEIDRMLSIMSAAIRLNVQLLPPLAEYLADALLSIVSGKDPGEALGYRFKRGGQERALKTTLNYTLGMITEQLLRRNPGMTAEEARNQIADEHFISYEAVKKHHQAFKKKRL